MVPARIQPNAPLAAYGNRMAWIWWLLAPLASTLAGSGALCWRAAREPGSARSRRDPMRQHQRLLQSLAAAHPNNPEPVTMLVLGAGD